MLIQHDGYENSLFLFEFKEFKHGQVKLIPLECCDLIGKKICQRFEMEDQGEIWWECGWVIAVVDGSDKENPKFVVEFDNEEQDEIEIEEEEENDSGILGGQEVCIFSLFEDYLNNDLKLL